MNTKKLGVVFLPGLTILTNGARTGTGALSAPVASIAPSKKAKPLAPELISVSGVTTAPGTLRLSIRLPTANSDGSPLVVAELIKMRIYYASQPGVSTSSPYVEQAPSTSTSFAPGLSGRVYVRVAVQDSHGSWSDLSNELSAEVPEAPRTEFWAHRLGEESIFSNNTPSSGFVSWSNVTLFFRGSKYTITDGNTNKRYIYWKLESPNTFLTSDTVPEIGINDVLIGTNVDGYWHLAIYHPQVSAEFIRVGALQSRNWGPSGGSFFNLDDGTLKLGGSSNPKFSWDGSTLRVEGNVVVTGGDVPYSYVTGGPPPNADNTAVAIGAGIITAGRIELGSSGSVKAGIDGAGTADSSIRFWAGATYANRASAPFRVTQGGALVATSATITGGALGGTGVITISSSGLDVGSSGSIRGGKTDYGSGTGFFLGYSGGAYKLDVGSSSQYLRWDGSSLVISGQLIAQSGSSIPYSYVTGGPPANADNTATVISGGLITTGRIELGSGTSIKAGIDGAGTSDSDIRFWAGATYANRASAPFRVTQGGALVATSATITGGVLGGSNVVTISSTGLDVGNLGSIRAGKTGYGSGTGFFLGYSDGSYKLDIGSTTQYLRWDGSSLIVSGQIVAQQGSSISYSYVTGGPPANADNTATVISGGLITTGRIELGSGSTVKAGIDGAGTSDSDIRFWAGSTYANRASAPFRVTQGGALVATSATITGGVLGGTGVISITSSGLDVGSSGSIRGGKTDYGSGTGFFLGYSGGAYKLDVGSSSQYIRWDGSTLSIVGNITVTGGSVPYSYVTGGPPANADNTATVISGGLITTGRIELGSGSTIKAGIDGAGTSDSDIRFWAGETYANRASAPFRVTQGGALVATSATITGGVLGGSGVVTITSTGLDVGTYGAIRGGKTDYGTGTGFFLGYSGTAYKIDIGSSSQYLRWDGSSLYVSGQIVAQSGSSISYSYITGGPPANADNTATVISGGLITTGRIELGSGNNVKAGIDGSGTSDSDIRFWAGATYQNRASAPFRVTQDGSLVATSATITGGVLGGLGVVSITPSGLDVGTYGAIRGGKTDYGTGTGFFLGYSGTAYKIDIGSSSQYLRWDGSSLNIAGNIIVTGGSIPYSFVTGGPPIDADNTATVISGGLITTGRIELGSPGNVKAGIDGAGTSDSDIRFWAGATYEGRALAPFRVTQGGQLVATSATITGGVLGGANVVTITPTGLDVGPYGSIRGGKTGYGSGTGFFLGYSGGTYRLDIGSSSQYLRWDGSTLTVTGRIVARSGSQVSADYVRSGSLIGVPVYGWSYYPQAQLINDYIRIIESQSKWTLIYSDSFVQRTPQGECYIEGNSLRLSWNSSNPTYIGTPASLTIENVGTLTFMTWGGDIVWHANQAKTFYPLHGCNLGSHVYYWRAIYFKDLYDVGCLGSFDEGIEYFDSRGNRKRMGAVQAIKAIKTKDGEKTHYGRTALDYSSFPPECYHPAPIAEQDFVDEHGRKFKKGEKIGNDAVSLSAVVSLLISAIKELDARLERLEGKAV